MSTRVTHLGKTKVFRFKDAEVEITPGRRFGERPVFTAKVTLSGLKPISYSEIQNPEWPEAGGKRYTAQEAADVALELAISDLEQELHRRGRKK